MMPRSKCKALVKRKPLSSVGWVTSFRNPTNIYINGQPADKAPAEPHLR